MQHRAGKNPGQQIKKEPLDLHVLTPEKAQYPQHVKPDQQLAQLSSPYFFLPGEQAEQQLTSRSGYTDIDKIKEKKDMSIRLPQQNTDEKKK